MNHSQRYIFFEGLNAGLSIKADNAFIEPFPLIFSHWPYEITSQAGREVFASIEQSNGYYTLSSPYISKAEPYREPVNAICAIVAELAWARLREDPSLLCLHGAAAEFGGRLVVFPATRRAGKSTLSVAMAAAGIRLFTDDFLPLSISEHGAINGISSGVSPRLRLPMPPQIGPRAESFLTVRKAVSNGQYTYVAPLNTEIAAFNESAPLGGIVFLDRIDGATARLDQVGKAEALKILVQQNFSRAGNAGDILAMLEFLAKNLPAYTLIYDDAEPAITILQQNFANWGAPLPHYQPQATLANDAKDGLRPFTTYNDVSSGQFEHAAGVQVVSADGKQFLTGRNGQSIHYLNEGAAMVWQILAEPTDIEEAADILSAAFPEQPRAQIEKDVLRCFKDFAKNGLLNQVEAILSAVPHPVEIHAK